jgi:hypothetical protein
VTEETHNQFHLYNILLSGGHFIIIHLLLSFYVLRQRWGESKTKRKERKGKSYVYIRRQKN